MNIMLDLETLGTRPGSVILSIGAVAFEPKSGKQSAEFYAEINTADALAWKLEIDNDTLNWWSEQNEEAQRLLKRCEQTSDTYENVLAEFDQWVHDLAPSKELKIWANDPNFDCSILSAAYQAIDRTLPWDNINERSCRTMVDLGRELGIDPKKDLPFEGTPHNALDDAKHQAKYISAIHQYTYSLNVEPKFKLKALN